MRFDLLWMAVGLMLVPLCQANQPPNIVVIVADDLGYGDLGVTGHDHIRTPHLDALAGSGARFDHFYSPAQICSPTRSAMLTGRMPHRHGIYSFIGGSSGNLTHLPKGEVTIPQLLRKAGYQTAIVGKWHCSLLEVQKDNPQIPTMDHYGFDYWFCSDDNAKILNKPGWIRNGDHEGKRKGLAANVVGQEAVHWLEHVRDPGKPFIQFVHFYEPHWYVEAPKEEVERYLESATENRSQAIYYGAVTNVDREVGRIRQTLKKLDLLDNTVIFFSSDHGPAKLGKGKTDRNYGTASPYRGNKYGLWDGSIHVPGIVSWPAGIRAGTVVNDPAGSIDWLPTICDLAGVELPESLELDGQSFYPLLKGESIDRRKPLQWHHYNTNSKNSPNPNAVLRKGKYVICGFYSPESQLRSPSWKPKHIDKIKSGRLVRFSLFDIENDPQQLKELSGELPGLYKKLVEELQAAHLAYQKQAVGWDGVTPVYP